MTTVSWLHLSDVHERDKEGYHRVAMYEAIVAEVKGNPEKPDFVFFTGDLAFSGTAAEYQLLEERLLRPLSAVLPLGCLLFMIPGNHDVDRTRGGKPRLWMTDEEERGKFQQIDRQGRQKRSDLLLPRFEAYRALEGRYSAWQEDWLASEQGSICKIVEVKGQRIAVIGINTAWLCQDDWDWGHLTAGRTMVDAALRQADAAQPDLRVVLGHHPLAAMMGETDWSDGDRIRLRLEQANTLYLHGHLHASGGQRAGDSMQSVLAIQAPSGFQAADSKVWRNGLLWAAADLSAGRLLLTPKRWNDDFRKYVFDIEAVDPRFRIDGKDSFTFPLPGLGLHTQDDFAEISTLPDFEPDLIRSRFVGREGLLTDFRLALRGMQARSAGHSDLASESAVQLFWIHGFGGMGKSWFIRRACMEAHEILGSAAKVGLVDWHVFAWHRPASTPPRDAQEMFDAIAYRLAKLYGVKSLSSYWTAKDALTSKLLLQREWRNKLDEALSFLQMHGRDWRNSYVQPKTHGEAIEFQTRLEKTETILERHGHLEGSGTEIAAQISRLRRTTPSYELPVGDVFEEWLSLFVADLDILRPTRKLADALLSCIRELTQSAPLILALDTCEILALHPLQDWLRYIFSQIIDGKTSIILIFGSRQRADVDAMGKHTWREMVDPKRFKSLDFDDAAFTRHDILVLLMNNGISEPLCQRLADHLFEITLGVPLAIAAIFDFYRNDDGSCEKLARLLKERKPDQARDLPREHVIKEVAERFLLHLKDRPRELMDIVSLALLLRADEAILGELWQGRPRNRLQELSERYTLLSDGDLHPTVRKYLREHWRVSPSPEVLIAAEALLAAQRELQSGNSDFSDDDIPLLVERLNLLSWTKGEDAYPELARAMVVFLASGYDVEPLRSLVVEIIPKRTRNRQVRLSVERNSWFSAVGIPDGIYDWLERESAAGDQRERACLDILRALHLNEDQDYAGAIRAFHKAFFALGERLPRKEYVLSAYFRAVVGLGQAQTNLARDALEWCNRLSFNPGSEWNGDYYWILHNSMDYEKTVAYCKQVIEAEPSELMPRAYLAHVYSVHLNRLDEAEAVLRDALLIDAQDATLHYFLAKDVLNRQSGRESEAEEEYLAALERTVSSADIRRVKLSLAAFYIKVMKDITKAAGIYRELAATNAATAAELNTIAWALYEQRVELEEARTFGSRALELAPEDASILQTYTAILVRLDMWAQALPLVEKWAMGISPQKLREQWHHFLPMFQDAHSRGHSAELAMLIRRLARNSEFSLLELALQVTSGTVKIQDVSATVRDAVKNLYRQIVESSAADFPVLPAA